MRLIAVWQTEEKYWTAQELSDDLIYDYSINGIIMRNVDMDENGTYYMDDTEPTDIEIDEAITTMNIGMDWWWQKTAA